MGRRGGVLLERAFLTLVEHLERSFWVALLKQLGSAKEVSTISRCVVSGDFSP